MHLFYDLRSGRSEVLIALEMTLLRIARKRLYSLCNA